MYTFDKTFTIFIPDKTNFIVPKNITLTNNNKSDIEFEKIQQCKLVCLGTIFSNNNEISLFGIYCDALIIFGPNSKLLNVANKNLSLYVSSDERHKIEYLLYPGSILMDQK